jgi:hypothetical protein
MPVSRRADSWVALDKRKKTLVCENEAYACALGKQKAPFWQYAKRTD